MYKTETIKKIMAALQALITYFMNLPYAALKLHISKGNSKIGKTHNFSMAPGHTCCNCSKCISWCYDLKACWQYLNVRIARAENTAMMYLDRAATFAKIAHYIATRRANKFFRWHVSGDILDVDYFDRMVQIARMFPDWVFWTYTKNYHAVNAWLDNNGRDALPANLSVMFSLWEGMECPNPYNMPTFRCILPGSEPDPDTWNCPGNCSACIKAGRGCPYGESSQVDAH